MRYLATLVVLAAVAGPASAEFSLKVVMRPVPIPELANYICNDLVITTDSDWLSTVMIVIPDDPAMASMVYQDPVGGITSPNPAFFPTFPKLEYDTYVSNGVVGEPVSIAPAVDYGYSQIEFTTDTDPATDNVALQFFTTDTDDVGTLHLARLTLHNTCQGTGMFIVTTAPAGGPKYCFGGPITDGIFLPEPAAMALLVLGGLMLLRRRR